MAYDPIFQECTPAQVNTPIKDGLVLYRNALDGFFYGRRWDGSDILIGGGGGGNDWLLNGNANVLEKWIGTQNLFDFPIRTNNVEVARFTTAGDLKLFGNILDSAGLLTIEPTGRILRTIAGLKSVDWQLHELYDNAIANVSVNYHTRQLFDFFAGSSVEWNSRHLRSSIGGITLDWELKRLYDTAGIVSVEWQFRQLEDSASLLAIEWNTRTLRDGQGLGNLNPVLDWSNIGTQGIGIVNVGSGTFAFLKNTLLTAPRTYELPDVSGIIAVNGWIQDGNSNGAIKYIGTNDAFDFPIRTTGVEVARFTTDLRLFIGATATNNGSNAGLQYSSLVANRAQFRANQYGANTAGGGITTFKSRGLVIGAVLSAGDGVLVGDIITGITGIAVTGSGLLIPIAYTQRVTAVEVLAGNVACDWEISLCPIGGATNSIRKVFAVTSEGIVRVRETANCMAGLAVLDGTGNIVIANTNIKATSRIVLTIQDGGAVPTGIIYSSARVVATSFTITSTAGVGDAGVQVYYQIYESLV